MDLRANQNLATLGCISPSGLAIHRVLQPVVTTTGRGYASPSGLRKSKGLGNSQRLEEGPKALALSPEGWHTLCRGRRPRQQGSSNRHRPGGPIQPGFSWPSKSSDPWVCQPFGLGNSSDASTGGYHHRQRVCQPFGLKKVQRHPFGYKPKDIHLALSPEGRHTLDLVGRQNLVTLGCVTIRDST